MRLHEAPPESFVPCARLALATTATRGTAIQPYIGPLVTDIVNPYACAVRLEATPTLNTVSGILSLKIIKGGNI